mmetsp:Transcript_29627/g.64665  ORF Transcript_29627/g.64665 Transcript_29627/m.64665 type:complete len:494 (-) Transcript_29627:208-1689(-)|eukprot:CAMPEP_0118958016 /NCGR_PEP_ID=MMETSP1169-20130426/62405_1 /TAXON_ID=36882 /ORGANISM="Pyramimonas obovata, Strain CCMP722" /LENGTH=493 /DNA_ID=CAMNT_0006906121 /DNA_START=493 /DNA_END=1974 /DNA_ORIENTATION=-
MRAGFFGPAPAAKPVPKMEELERKVEGAPPVQQAPRVALSAFDFKMGKHLGDGSFSQVVKAERKGTDEIYALKIMDKRHILREKKAEYIKNERNILDRLTYEGVVRLYFTFQDDTTLYMGLELCEDGELFTQIRRKGRMTLEDARFYAAEVVLILDAVHSAYVIHRDVKPENLLIAANGHLKLCDFGSAKIVNDQKELVDGIDKEDGSGKRKGSFVGTAEYVAPETLNGAKLTKSTDFWSLGCVLFQMLVGKPPFKGETEYLTFQKVVNFEMMPFPDHVPEAAKDLILKLLVTDQDQRLGAGPRGQEELRSHPFFEGVDWENIRQQDPPSVAPPSRAEEEDAAGEAEDAEAEARRVETSMGGGAGGANEEELGANNSEHEACVEKHLQEGECVVHFSEVALLHNGVRASVSTVLLVLTDTPRLFFLDPVASMMRMQLPIKYSEVAVTGPKGLVITTPNGAFEMETGGGGDAQKWADLLHSIIAEEADDGEESQ